MRNREQEGLMARASRSEGDNNIRGHIYMAQGPGIPMVGEKLRWKGRPVGEVVVASAVGLSQRCCSHQRAVSPEEVPPPTFDFLYVLVTHSDTLMKAGGFDAYIQRDGREGWLRGLHDGRPVEVAMTGRKPGAGHKARPMREETDILRVKDVFSISIMRGSTVGRIRPSSGNRTQSTANETL